MSNSDLIQRNETNQNSKGGTELLQDRLYDGSVPRELLEQFQIIFSRVRDLDESKFRILYCHDLPGDPESEVLRDGGWNNFHKLVFVSNWQLQAYINYYGIPWSHCEVIENSIVPIDETSRMFDAVDGKGSTINLCYTSTPHRGLDVLYAAFNALSKKHDNIVLDVFSSFKLYGWGERDEQFRELFDAIDNHPKINNYGTQSNEYIRNHLANVGDILAYPSTWQETSCLCLIEAMSAGLMCVHSNYGALPDTASGFTHMYQYDEDKNYHATKLYHILDGAIANLMTDDTMARRRFAKMYADNRFNWNFKSYHWTGLLSSIAQQNPDKQLPGSFFHYNG
jgi:UDP-glucose:(glucosyl)LPS alpha-1,2-glucosyltransferase